MPSFLLFLVAGLYGSLVFGISAPDDVNDGGSDPL